MKDLHKTYRSYLSLCFTDNPQQTGSQFLLLRLCCAKGTYDINVEPAKNEVMLEDSAKVKQLFEDLCIRVYGEKDTAQSGQHSRSVKSRAAATSSFDVLLAKKQPAIEQQQTSTVHASANLSVHDASGLSQSRVDPEGPSPSCAQQNILSKDSRQTYTLDDQEQSARTGVSLPSWSGAVEAEEQDDVMDPHVTNPFVLAKMNIRLQPQNVTAPSGESPHQVDQIDAGGQRSPVSATAVACPALMPTELGLLPSPRSSPDRDHPYQNPGPPNRPWRIRQERETGEASSNISVSVNSPRPTLLDSWAQNVNSSSPVQSSLAPIEVRRSEPVYRPELSSRSPMQSAARGDTAHTSTKSRRPAPQAPFRTPFKKPAADMLPGGQQSLPSPEVTPGLSFRKAQLSPSSRPREEGPQLPGFSRVRIDPSTELEDIMDFEHRKKDIILQHRGKQPKRQMPASHEAQALADDDVQLRIPANLCDADATSQTTGEKIDYATKFATVASRADESSTPPDSSSASFLQNPHQNRYKRAIRDLEERSRDARHSDMVDPAAEGTEPALVQNLNCNRFKLSPNDPRAYLIRHQDEQEAESLKSAKSRRTKTTKLPFETIPSSSSTSGLLATLDASLTVDATSLQRVAELLRPSEPYVRSGPAGLSGSILRNGSEVMSDLESQVRILLDERAESMSSSSNAGNSTVGTVRQVSS